MCCNHRLTPIDGGALLLIYDFLSAVYGVCESSADPCTLLSVVYTIVCIAHCVRRFAPRRELVRRRRSINSQLSCSSYTPLTNKTRKSTQVWTAAGCTQLCLYKFTPKLKLCDSVYIEIENKKILNTEVKTYLRLRVGADLTGGHSCSGRRGPWEAGPWRPRASGPQKAKFWLAKSWLQLELNLWFI